MGTRVTGIQLPQLSPSLTARLSSLSGLAAGPPESGASGRRMVLGPFAEGREQVGEKPRDLILALGVALEPDYPAMLRAFQSLDEPVVHIVGRGHQPGRPLSLV